MNIKNQIKINYKFRNIFSGLEQKISHNLSLPKKRFVKQMLTGILKSNSVIVRRIGQSLNENIYLKKTSERLYRNIKEKGLDEKLRDNLLIMQSKQLNEDSLILIDPSDIMKTSSKKMEGISRTRDGSIGEIGNGYDLLNIVGVVKQPNGNYNLLPISSELYSKEIEIDTKAGIILDRVTDITIHSGNKGVFIIDRGGDTRINLEAFTQNDNSYIIRSMGQRNLIVDDKELNFKKVCKLVDLKYEIPGRKAEEEILCGMKRVKVRLSPYPKKNALKAETNLIVCRYKSITGKLGGYFYFLSNFPNKNLTERDIVERSVKFYKIRWNIEETHRQVKQDYEWEKMQLLSYQGLKTLNVLLWIVLSYVYSLKEYTFEMALAYPALMIDSYRDFKRKFNFFVYYRIFRVVSEVFRFKRIYKKFKYKKPPSTKVIQLELQF